MYISRNAFPVSYRACCGWIRPSNIRSWRPSESPTPGIQNLNIWNLTHQADRNIQKRISGWKYDIFFPTISGFFNVSTCFHGQSLVVQQKKLLMVMFIWVPFIVFHLEVSWNGGTFKSSILVGCSIINHLFWGTPMAMESPIYSARECVYAVSELPTWARSPASSRTHLAVYPIFVWICSHIYTEYIWYIYIYIWYILPPVVYPMLSHAHVHRQNCHLW